MNLISSHVNSLVECGWWLRFLYILGWFAVAFLIHLSAIAKTGPPSVGGVWVCWFVAMTFSHLASTWQLWVLPSLLLASTFKDWRSYRVNWRHARNWGIVYGAVCLGIPSLSFAAAKSNRVQAFSDGSVIIEGVGELQVALCDPDTDVLGALYGHAARSSNSTTGVVRTGSSIDRHLPRAVLVFSGSTSPWDAEWTEACRDRDIVLFNPTFPPDDLRLLSARSVRVVFGEFTRADIRLLWSNIGCTVTVLPGEGNYLKNWVNHIPGYAEGHP